MILLVEKLTLLRHHDFITALLRQESEITLDKIFQMRKLADGETTNYFYRFVRDLGGYGHNRTEYAAWIKKKPISKCLSVPSEAFLLLLIENFAQRVAYDVLYGNNTTSPAKGQEGKKRPTPLYTKGGGGAPVKNWNSGWHPKGTNRFNEISNMVQTSRNHPRAKEWEERFRASMAEKESSNVKKRKAKGPLEVAEQPYNTMPNDW
jgi:hypothetical protein